MKHSPESGAAPRALVLTASALLDGAGVQDAWPSGRSRSLGLSLQCQQRGSGPFLSLSFVRGRGGKGPFHRALCPFSAKGWLLSFRPTRAHGIVCGLCLPTDPRPRLYLRSQPCFKSPLGKRLVLWPLPWACQPENTGHVYFPRKYS